MLQQEGTFVSSLPNPDLVEQSDFKFPNALSQFVTTRSYLRWMDSEGRREDYPEAVARYVGFISKHRNIPPEILSSIQKSMLQMGVLPSMRALWSAGPAAERDNTMIYNCSFVPLDSLRSFSELLYILMMGTGVGYSVESQFVENLPEVSPRSGERIPYVIEDSTEGWANAFFDGLSLMWKGHTVDFDYSKIREAGARCNTKGGRASGPEPLRRLLDFSQKLLDKASGRKLYDIEASDIACMVGEIVMAGGVRRAALICFSDPASERMRFVKKFPTCLECGHGWDNHLSDEGRGGHLLSAHGMTEEEYLQKHPDAYIGFPACRFMANVSGFWGVDPEKGSARPPQEVFWAEWEALKNSGSGERGFFMFPLSKQKERRGDCRSNPCGEILLRYSKSQDPWTGEGGGGQFCNLSAAVMRAEDTRESFAEKVRTATWIGAIQSTFTFFPYLRPAWKAHCFTGDTKISLLNGEEVAIRDLVGRENFWVYSYDLETGKMVPGKAHSVRKTRENANLVRVTLDNGEHFDCTPDHLVLTRGGMYKEAGHLQSGDSLMPLYRRLSTEDDEGKNGRIGYEMCSTGDGYEFTHTLTAGWANRGCCEVCGVPLPEEKHCIRHHADFNKRNNDPNNFQWLTWVEHNHLHSEVASALLTEMWKDPEFRQKMVKVRQDWWGELKADPERYAAWSARQSEILSGILNRLWKDPEYRETTLVRLRKGHQAYMDSDRFRENQESHLQTLWSDPDFVEKFMDAAREGIKRKWSEEEYREKMQEVSRSLWTDEFKERMRPHQSRNGKLYGKKNLVDGWNKSESGRRKSSENLRYERTPEHKSAMSLVAKKHTHVRWHVKRGEINPDCQFCSPNNHKVVSVEALPHAEDVYDLTVDTYHNFALSCGVFVHNCDEDRLLGVDVTGHCDNPNLSGDAEAMSYFNQVALETAAEAAAWLNIPMPAAITCGKPSGNSSQAVDCSSGFHPRYSPYYVRRVRISAKDPLFHLVRDSGAPVHKETKWRNAPDEECPTWVVEFPVAAPEGAMTRNDETALQQLERYLQVMQTWCSKRGHNQSATIYVRDNEWQEVGQWVWDHFDQITGLSFLPHSDFKYALAPYEEIDQVEYESRLRDFPRVDYSALSLYEKMDEGEGAQNLACVGGVCEI